MIHESDIYRIAGCPFPQQRWCLRWRTSKMPGSAFYYFRTKKDAARALRKLSATYEATPPVIVSAPLRAGGK